MSGTKDVTLVGAGLAGSLLAIYLARSGHQVTIFERRPDMRRSGFAGGRSINLALANRGLAALQEVRLRDELDPLMVPMAGRMLHDESGNLQFLPYGNKPHEVIHSVSRGGLNALLMDEAERTGGVNIHFENACTGVDFGSREVITARPEGEESRFRYEVLIGTDGSASAVRAAIIEATRGSVDQQPLGHSYKELSIPPAAGGGHRMHANSLHIWPRGEYMLIALPNIDGSFTVTLFLPNEGEESFAALNDPAAVRSLFERRFADAIPLIDGLEQQFFENPTGHLETVRASPWYLQDHALILGDAAHAIVPFHGQGMNAAFEDCSALNRLMGTHPSWNERFAAFEEERKPNTDAIADMALENYVEMRSTVRDPKFALRKALSFLLEERFPDRFIPRYSMVMFHSIPYAEARARGGVQEEILAELTEEASRVEEVDLARAANLIAERLRPLRNGGAAAVR
jgi:kynurenine 3-monooxygenase